MSDRGDTTGNDRARTRSAPLEGEQDSRAKGIGCADETASASAKTMGDNDGDTHQPRKPNKPSDNHSGPRPIASAPSTSSNDNDEEVTHHRNSNTRTYGTRDNVSWQMPGRFVRVARYSIKIRG